MQAELELAQRLDAIPNPPYLPSMIAESVKAELQRIPGIEIAEDAYAVYARWSNPNQGQTGRIVFDTHLDHPGFIATGKNRAIGLGSLQRTETIAGINPNQSYSVAFINPHTGEIIANGQLENFVQKGGITLADIRADQDTNQIAPNTVVMPLLTTYFEGPTIRMRAADNLATAAACIALLDDLAANRIPGRLPVEVIFSKLEEVRQITATGIAQRGATPFGPLSAKDLIFVLEAGPLHMAANDPHAFDHQGLGIITSERDLEYTVDNQPNLAHRAVLTLLDEGSIPYIQTGAPSHSDAAPYIAYGLSPHITTVAIPIRNRHNLDENGILTTEDYPVASFFQLLDLMEKLANHNFNGAQPHSGEYTGAGNSPQVLNRHKTALSKSLAWAQPRLERQYLQPESIQDQLAFIANSLLLRLTR